MKKQTYFNNHFLSDIWPFNIYHQPIDEKIINIISKKRGGDFLNVGCGLFSRFPVMKKYGRWTAVDIDESCIELVKKTFPEIKTQVSSEIPNLPNKKFDFIFAKEVIEHVQNPRKFLKALINVLKPDGTLFLSTPNYGFPFLLPAIEYSFLEIVARFKGYTRIGIHPNKFTAERLRKLLQAEKPENSLVEIQSCSLKMVLIGILNQRSFEV